MQFYKNCNKLLYFLSSLPHTQTPNFTKSLGLGSLPLQLLYLTHTHIYTISPETIYFSITKMQLLRPFSSILAHLSTRWPLLIYAATWTMLLTLTVALASFSPEVSFVSAISSSSSFSRACVDPDMFIRVPIDLPAEILCLPAHRFAKSNLDLIVPPVFAAVVVAASAFLVRALALWEDDVPH